MLILKSTLALLFTAAIAVHAAPGNTAPLGDVGVEVSPDGLDVDVSVDGADVDLSIDDEGIELNGSVELAARRSMSPYLNIQQVSKLGRMDMLTENP